MNKQTFNVFRHSGYTALRIASLETISLTYSIRYVYFTDEHQGMYIISKKNKSEGN